MYTYGQKEITVYKCNHISSIFSGIVINFEILVSLQHQYL